MVRQTQTWLGRAGSSLRAGVIRAWQLLAGPPARRTVVLPGAARLSTRQALPKPTPAALRRFSETPVARKAINTIKDRIAGMQWRVQRKRGSPIEHDGDQRIAVLTANLDTPNPDDSFRSLTEQIIEDVLVGGWGAMEAQLTADAGRPLALWPVDGATIRIYAGWSGAGADTHLDYPAANSYVRELPMEELTTLAGQLRQGAREVLLSDAFAQSVAAAQGLAGGQEMFEAAAGLLINGEICRIHNIRPLDAGDEVYAWQLLCDAPLAAA